MLMKYVLENIIKRRKEIGYNQEEMAKQLHIAQSNYGRLEQGKTEMTLEKLFRISEILKTRPTSLLGMPVDLEKELRKNEQALIDRNREYSAKIEELEKELKEARTLYRGYYLLIKRIYEIIIDPEFKDLSDGDITLEMLNRKWNEKKDNFKFDDPMDHERYRFNNPEGFGFTQDSIGHAVSIAKALLSNHIENVLNKNPDKFGFNDHLFDPS